MSENGAQGAQIPGTSAQGANAQGANGTSANQNQNQPEYVSKADYDSLVTKLDKVISDNAKYRGKLREGKPTGNAKGNDSDSDGLESDLSEKLAAMQTKIKTANFRAAITSAANRANSVIADDMYRLLNVDEYADDDDGNISAKNADAIMEELKKTNPKWFEDKKVPPAGINAGAGDSNSPTTDMNVLIRRAAHRTRVGAN